MARSQAYECAIYGNGVFAIQVKPLNICLIKNLWLQKTLRVSLILACYQFACQRSQDLKSALLMQAHDIEKLDLTCSRMEHKFVTRQPFLCGDLRYAK